MTHSHVVSRFTLVLLFVGMMLSTPALSQTNEEPQRAGLISSDGALVTRDVKLPLSLMLPYSEPGALVTSEGLILPHLRGILTSRWEPLSYLIVRPDVITVALGDPTMLEVHVAVTKTVDGSPAQPYLKDPKGFVTAVVELGGYQLLEDHGSVKVYQRQGKAPKNAKSSQFFPYSGRESWLEPWPTEELAKLGPKSGITTNATGVAWVSPAEVKAFRWDQLDFLHVEGLEYKGASVAVLSSKSPSGLEISFPNHFYLPWPSFLKYTQQLQALYKDSRFTPPTSASFYPLYTTLGDWVAGAPVLETSSAAKAQPAELGEDLWPNEISEPGLYLSSAGVVQVEDRQVTFIEWASMTQMFAHEDGGFEFDPGSVKFSPGTNEEVALFRQIRREVLRVSGLEWEGDGFWLGTGQSSEVKLEPCRYDLAAQWEGLPLSLLGAQPWPEGLYLLPEGLVSVHKHFIQSAGWGEVDRLHFREQSESSCSFEADLKNHGGLLPDPNRHVQLSVSAKEAQKIFDRFGTRDEENGFQLKPVGQLPTERVRIEYSSEY